MVKKEALQPSVISDLLMELLVCPVCKGDLTLSDRGDQQALVCQGCRLSYPISDGIPVMLVDSAAKA